MSKAASRPPFQVGHDAPPQPIPGDLARRPRPQPEEGSRSWVVVIAGLLRFYSDVQEVKGRKNVLPNRWIRLGAGEKGRNDTGLHGCLGKQTRPAHGQTGRRSRTTRRRGRDEC